MHELLRQYAAEKLDESPDEEERVRDRHGAFYVAALQRWGKELKGPAGKARWPRWTPRSTTRARPGTGRPSGGRWSGWIGRWMGCAGSIRTGVSRGRTACRALVNSLTMVIRLYPAVTGATFRLWINALVWQANFPQAFGTTERARQLLYQGLALLDSPAMARRNRQRARVLYRMGRTKSISDPEQARGLFEQSLTLSREVGNRRMAAYALWSLAWEAKDLGNLDESRRLGEECLAIRQALGDHKNVARSLG